MRNVQRMATLAAIFQMKTAEETRLTNLNALFERYSKSGKGLAHISQKTGVNESYLSVLGTGGREISSKMARRLESGLGLERGWLDNNHDIPNLTPNDKAKLYDLLLIGFPEEARQDIEKMVQSAADIIELRRKYNL